MLPEVDSRPDKRIPRASTIMFTLLHLILPVVVAICPQGTIYRQEFERCYKFSTVKKSYSLAETDCLSLGGHLVSIQNGYENAMLIETAQADHFPLPFYIGLTSLDGGLWSWNDGTPGHMLQILHCEKVLSLAETDCLSLGGHLVSIQNGYENAMLIETAQADHFPLPFYIGLTSLDGGLWSWNDGTPATYTNWAHGQPGQSNQCAVSGSPNGIWSTKSCSELVTYVCAIDAGSILPTSCPPPVVCPPRPACIVCPPPPVCPAPPACPTCPPTPVCPAPTICSTSRLRHRVLHQQIFCVPLPKSNSRLTRMRLMTLTYSLFADMAKTGEAYKNPNSLTWIGLWQAGYPLNYRSGRGDSMGQSFDYTELGYMAKTGEAYKNPNSLAWIGLWQAGYPLSTQWAWTDGTSFDYSNWAVGEPNNADGNEHCVQIYSDHEGTDPVKDTQFQKWNDYYCSDAMRAYIYSDQEGTDPVKDTQFQKWNDYYCSDAMRAYVCKKPALH
ncbi:lectin C-type domain protein [Ostertagia ostertagi]